MHGHWSGRRPSRLAEFIIGPRFARTRWLAPQGDGDSWELAVMASLKDMRVRIASTKATQKITKAMQMVAASRLRRAQQTAEAARPYAERMAAVITNIAN